MNSLDKFNSCAGNRCRFDKSCKTKMIQHRLLVIVSRNFSCSFLLFILLSNNSQLFSQNKVAFSVGISKKWDFIPPKKQLNGVEMEDVISLGGTGYFATFGFNWSHKRENQNGENYWSSITIEKFTSQLDDWERTPIGSVDAIIFRIDPIVGDMHIKNPKFLIKGSPFGISIYTGKANLLPDSYCYDVSSWYLIEQMSIRSAIGWSLVNFEIAYKISSRFLLGFETVFIENDDFKAVFQTSSREIVSDVATAYFFFPFKFRFTAKI